jgi:hypothetical protein
MRIPKPTSNSFPIVEVTGIDWGGGHGWISQDEIPDPPLLTYVGILVEVREDCLVLASGYSHNEQGGRLNFEFAPLGCLHSVRRLGSIERNPQ